MPGFKSTKRTKAAKATTTAKAVTKAAVAREERSRDYTMELALFADDLHDSLAAMMGDLANIAADTNRMVRYYNRLPNRTQYETDAWLDLQNSATDLLGELEVAVGNFQQHYADLVASAKDANRPGVKARALKDVRFKLRCTPDQREILPADVDPKSPPPPAVKERASR